MLTNLMLAMLAVGPIAADPAKVEAKDHREIWPARLEVTAVKKTPEEEFREEFNRRIERIIRDVTLEGGTLQELEHALAARAEKKPEPPAKADILANHKLYNMEPGAEKEYVGVIKKLEKGGYVLLMEAGNARAEMSLHLYPDSGDPLAPYVEKKVRLVGKYKQFVLPGCLEVIEGKK